MAQEKKKEAIILNDNATLAEYDTILTEAAKKEEEKDKEDK